MVRRRNSHDPLATSSHPHWLVIQDMTGMKLNARELSPGTDLRAILADAKNEWAAAGWEIEDSSWQYSSNFFCNKDGVRRFVTIQPTDPAKPMIGPVTYPGKI